MLLTYVTGRCNIFYNSFNNIPPIPATEEPGLPSRAFSIGEPMALIDELQEALAAANKKMLTLEENLAEQQILLMDVKGEIHEQSAGNFHKREAVALREQVANMQNLLATVNLVKHVVTKEADGPQLEFDNLPDALNHIKSAESSVDVRITF